MSARLEMIDFIQEHGVIHGNFIDHPGLGKSMSQDQPYGKDQTYDFDTIM